MSDATREEVIEWCRNNEVDFKKPLFPPPAGWGWYGGKEFTLCPIFTNTDQGEEVTAAEVYGVTGDNTIH